MKLDLYPSATNGSKYLVVPAGTDFKVWTPADPNLDDDFRQVRPLHSSGDYEKGQHRIGINTDQVLEDIASKGWSAVQVNVTVSVSTSPPRSS